WLSPVVYYRLKQVDYDATVSYTYQVAVEREGDIEVILYPNPAKEEATLAVFGEEKVESVRVYDVYGKDLSGDINIRETDGFYTLDVKGLRNGTYMVQITTASQSVTERLVVGR
ncbi:MAG: T9SS type A sorting domain-containing protein, partial [Bacteroidia bacterium]|nr:T9SS type A sorting domain-containing protein [Bacteroidia bacterium]